MANNPYVNKVVKADGTIIIDISDTTAAAADVASGKYFYTASGEKAAGTASGGGVSNVVTGTFKSAATSASVDVDVDYSGTGYPIAMLIFPAEGGYNVDGTFFQTALRGAITLYTIIKNRSNIAPLYSDDTAADRGSYFSKYKSSSTDNTAMNIYNGYATFYKNGNAATGFDKIVRLRSNKKFAVYMCAAGGSQNGGFAPNVDYRYVIVYSS